MQRRARPSKQLHPQHRRPRQGFQHLPRKFRARPRAHLHSHRNLLLPPILPPFPVKHHARKAPSPPPPPKPPRLPLYLRQQAQRLQISPLRMAQLHRLSEPSPGRQH